MPYLVAVLLVLSQLYLIYREDFLRLFKGPLAAKLTHVRSVVSDPSFSMPTRFVSRSVQLSFCALKNKQKKLNERQENLEVVLGVDFGYAYLSLSLCV